MYAASCELLTMSLQFLLQLYSIVNIPTKTKYAGNPCAFVDIVPSHRPPSNRKTRHPNTSRHPTKPNYQRPVTRYFGLLGLQGTYVPVTFRNSSQPPGPSEAATGMGTDIDYDMSPFLAPAVWDGQGYGGTGAPVAYGMLG